MHWITKDKKIIPIQMLDNTHIENILKRFGHILYGDNPDRLMELRLLCIIDEAVSRFIDVEKILDPVRQEAHLIDMLRDCVEEF